MIVIYHYCELFPQATPSTKKELYPLSDHVFLKIWQGKVKNGQNADPKELSLLANEGY